MKLYSWPKNLWLKVKFLVVMGRLDRTGSERKQLMNELFLSSQEDDDLKWKKSSRWVSCLVQRGQLRREETQPFGNEGQLNKRWLVIERQSDSLGKRDFFWRRKIRFLRARNGFEDTRESFEWRGRELEEEKKNRVSQREVEGCLRRAFPGMTTITSLLSHFCTTLSSF